VASKVPGGYVLVAGGGAVVVDGAVLDAGAFADDPDEATGGELAAVPSPLEDPHAVAGTTSTATTRAPAIRGRTSVEDVDRARDHEDREDQ
jgi:hypothetical protein